MKYLSIALVLFLLMGCQLIPKKVEYFQDTVKSLPTYDQKDMELLKQSLLLSSQSYDRISRDNAALKARLDEILGDTDKILLESLSIAIQDPEAPLTPDVVKEKAIEITEAADNVKVNTTEASGLSDNIAADAAGAGKVTAAASSMVGPPKKEFKGEPEDLAEAVTLTEAKLDEKLYKYAQDIADVVGKKIEGSGAIQIGYFNNLLLIGVVLFMGYIVLKALALGNPAISVGSRVIKAGSGVVSTAATQMISAVDLFKDKVRRSQKLSPEVQDEIREMLRAALNLEQDKPVKDLVAKVRGKKD